MSTSFGRSALRRGPHFISILLLALLISACGSSNSGFPREPGRYSIQSGSVTFDGKKYGLVWQDAAGALHPAEGRDVRMQRADQTFLEIGSGSPVINLKEDQAVSVKGRDRDGDFTSSWFPFLLGYGLGNLGGGGYSQRYPGDTYGNGPAYQYPPTDTFGRGDQLNGTVERSRAETPDYGKVQPAPYAVSGQGGGTGSGSAATNKATAPTSGQSGGSGSGSAASNKGTFSSGGSPAGLDSRSSGTGVGGGSGWSSPSRPSTGLGGSTGGSRAPVGGGARKR